MLIASAGFVENDFYMLDLEDHVAPERARLLARLGDLGYADLTEYPYDKYLATALWKKIRGFVRKRDGFKCQVCSNGLPQRKGVDLDVHHRSYDLVHARKPSIRTAPELVSTLP